MFLRRRSETRTSRGQAMAEFAILLPIMLLLLVFAIDFGRVFFGWVGLQNVARIGANFAAQYPDADWGDSTDEDRVKYEAQMQADSAAINCTLPPDDDMLPDFPGGTDVGAEAVVTLECEFDLITPLLAPLFGGTTVPMSAQATFPIRAGALDGATGGGPADPPVATCREIPDMIDMFVADARAAWTGALFTGNFYPAGTAQDGEVVTAQFPNPFASPGACVDATTSVTISSEPLPPPPCEAPELRVPKLVGLNVGPARTLWFDTGFNAGTFSPASGSNGQPVQSQQTNPDTDPGDCALPSTTMVVTIGTPPVADCVVPDFIGSHSGGAQSTWTAAGFTTTVSFRVQGQLPYIIQDQNRVANSLLPCTSTIQVGPG